MAATTNTPTTEKVLYAPAAPATDTVEARARPLWGLLRLSMGWIFLWAFLDKLLALGFATGRNPKTGIADRFGDAAWIHGGSPTDGFLQFGLHTKAPFSGFYDSLVGSTFIEWAYMLSMVAIGIALILGITTRLAAGFGVLWMAMFYTASALSPENNPFLDEHVVYAIVLVGLALVGGGRYLGLGRRWEQLTLVEKHPILR
jgi:thiosulfate dehydrogenase [quinone] large subunit